jgi:hypothetical protein
VLPEASRVVNVPIVVPSANMLPDAGVAVTLTAPFTMSVALAENVTPAPAALVASAIRFAGAMIVGAVLSRTETVNEPVAAFPASSVAIASTVVIPSANVEP